RALEVRGVDAEVIDEAARVAARQLRLEPLPVAPVLAEGLFLLLLRRAVVLVGGRQRQAQRLLELPLHHQPGDPLAAGAGDRAEALVVEIVRHPAALDRL